jgi:hypothetical protein
LCRLAGGGFGLLLDVDGLLSDMAKSDIEATTGTLFRAVANIALVLPTSRSTI